MEVVGAAPVVLTAEVAVRAAAGVVVVEVATAGLIVGAAASQRGHVEQCGHRWPLLALCSLLDISSHPSTSWTITKDTREKRLMEMYNRQGQGTI